MFINILHKTFIAETGKFSLITPEFFDIKKEENWIENKKEYVDFGEYLTNLTKDSTRQYRVYPIKDLHDFLKQYCHFLGLTYPEYREIINFNIFSLRHAEDTWGFPNKIMPPKSEDWFSEYKMSNKKIKRNYELYPAEFSINCLDRKWAQDKFHFFRICDIVTEIKKHQRKEYEEYGIISDSFSFLTANNLTSHQLLNRDCYNKVYITFKQRGYNTDLFDMSIEEYINNPNCLFGYNELNYYKFNTHLARQLQKRGYRIDEQ